MMTLLLVPENIRTPICQYRYIFYVLSVVLLIASAILFFTRGLNYGIDFSGGTLVELAAEEAIDLASLRARLSALELGDVQVQHFGSPREVLVRVEGAVATSGGTRAGDTRAGGTRAGDARVEQATVKTLRDAIGEDYEFRRVETVGPTVSAELIQAGILAVVVAVALVLVYIWIRFEWQFSLGAVLALMHDVSLTIGVFSLLQFEFNLSIIAALLTIIGYSLNDTVVVYDRVRENLRKYRKIDLISLFDLSIAQTLSRTVMTSLTTLLALFSLYIIGGEVLKGFAFAMIWGVVVGTYSSVFIATPLLLATNVKRDWKTTR